MPKLICNRVVGSKSRKTFPNEQCNIVLFVYEARRPLSKFNEVTNSVEHGFLLDIEVCHVALIISVIGMNLIPFAFNFFIALSFFFCVIPTIPSLTILMS